MPHGQKRVCHCPICISRFILLGKEELVEELHRVLGAGDRVADGALVLVDLVVVSALEGLPLALHH